MSKLYPCKECGTKVPIRSKGLCPACRNKQKQSEENTFVYRKKINPISNKKRVEKSLKRKELDVFFEYHLEQLEKKPFSQLSAKYISTPTTANIAHILPKRKQGGFPSISNHLENCIYLTIEEHSLYDSLMDKREFEKIKTIFGDKWSKMALTMEKLLKTATERNKLYFDLGKFLNLF